MEGIHELHKVRNIGCMHTTHQDNNLTATENNEKNLRELSQPQERFAPKFKRN